MTKTMQIMNVTGSPHDATITTPDEIHVHDDGSATACHANGDGDWTYSTLAQLLEAYTLSADSVSGR